MQAEDLLQLGVRAQLQQLKALDPRSCLEPPCVIQASLAPSNVIKVGSFTGLYGGRVGHAEIGRYCSISYNVDISSDQHPIDWMSTSMVQYVENIHGWKTWLSQATNEKIYTHSNPPFASGFSTKIGNDVWIGQGAFIKSGVTIGDGAVVAAHAVVVKDVEPYAIVAGVPARTVRKRFDEPICAKLMELQWWNYCIYSIPDLRFNDIGHCIETLSRHLDNGTIEPFSPSMIYPKDL